jgi:hypothetical protein
MKFQVGDLVLVKEHDYKSRLHLRPRLYLRLPYHLDFYYYPHLKNTYGVITEAINHTDACEGDSTEGDNVYFWYSQVDAETYWFCEGDLTEYEVAK